MDTYEMKKKNLLIETCGYSKFAREHASSLLLFFDSFIHTGNIYMISK